VGTAADLYWPIADEKHIGFVVEADAVPPIYGDRDLMIEAVANLLDNAIKFVPSGGAVRLSITGTSNGPIVRVEDNGPGIPANEREAVLTRFYRVDKSRHIKGHGLGLSIVLAIVKLHDFDLSVGDASPGCIFELRCYQPDRSLSPTATPPAEKHSSRRRWRIRPEGPTEFARSGAVWAAGNPSIGHTG
jgi:signal transduction histidine kinase